MSTVQASLQFLEEVADASSDLEVASTSDEACLEDASPLTGGGRRGIKESGGGK